MHRIVYALLCAFLLAAQTTLAAPMRCHDVVYVEVPATGFWLAAGRATQLNMQPGALAFAADIAPEVAGRATLRVAGQAFEFHRALFWLAWGEWKLVQVGAGWWLWADPQRNYICTPETP